MFVIFFEKDARACARQIGGRLMIGPLSGAGCDLKKIGRVDLIWGTIRPLLMKESAGEKKACKSDFNRAKSRRRVSF